MKIDKGVSTWRIWGFYRYIYIECLKELTFAKSKNTGNNCPLTTMLSSSPTRTNTGHTKNQYTVYCVLILSYLHITCYLNFI